MKEDKNAMFGGIAFLVVLVLGVWWFSASMSSGAPASTDTDATAPVDITTPPATLETPATPSKPKATSATPAKKLSGVSATVASISNGSTFGSLLSSTGAANEVSGSGPYTIFVPTDGAFSRLPSGTVSKMTAAQKRRLVEYHVIVGRAVDADANIAGVVTALSNDPLNFTVNPDKSISVGNAKIVDTHKASNGVVYTIDTVLLPPQKDPAFQVK